jgi:hypothetical protein
MKVRARNFSSGVAATVVTCSPGLEDVLIFQYSLPQSLGYPGAYDGGAPSFWKSESSSSSQMCSWVANVESKCSGPRVVSPSKTFILEI